MSGAPARLRRVAAICSIVVPCVLCIPAARAADWLDAQGRPNANAHAALRLLGAAADDGLDPAQYRATELTRVAVSLDEGENGVSAFAFAESLQAAMLRYLRHLHLGRVDPRSLGFRLGSLRKQAPEFLALLDEAAANGQLPEAAARLRPGIPQYERLRTALAHYRALARQPAEAALPATRTVQPGHAYEHAATLHRRLVMLGDLPVQTPAPAAPVYGDTLVSGVAHFQARHGLAVDGLLGRATQAALNVPIDSRVRQIELAMERLRWLPRLDAQHFIGINIPMFRLWAWDPANGGAAPLEMGVVVGRALDTQTPVLAGELRHLVFRPYWNVPRSIVRKEVLPVLLRQPDYLERHDMEVVLGQGDDAQAVPATAESLALLERGELRLRQRAGPDNSLGLVKFVFPNDADVYLHGTPATELFGRPRRDFSHGCVRLEDPVALARWVLAEQPEWTGERIEAAMNDEATPSLRVPLARPIPVILFYTTAMVRPGDQAVHFADDIYRHDARLERALRLKPGS